LISNHGQEASLYSADAWIFDLDGTLTIPQHDFDDLRRRLGLAPQAPILEAIAAASPSRAQRLSEQVAAWELELARVSRPAPGAHGLLQYLRSTGTQLGLVTRNRRDIARLTLDVIGLEQFFRPENILGRDEAPPKPSPEGIQSLMSNWQAEGGVMVGDYRYDLEAGRAAGCFTIHVAAREQSAWHQWTDLHVISLEILLARLMSLGDRSRS